ncbi:2-hydroxyacid dehydrogenase [Stella sp.]|uniref:2-hydroxyacid dehydrogenase n=1 Tax=Stella sp. TaxID=2912054 RepID=UPI0035AEE613
MKPDIVLIAQYPPQIMAVLEENFTCHKMYEAPDRAAFLAAVAGKARGLASTGVHGAPRDLILALPKLEIISGFGVGYDAVDLPTVKEKGIVLTNTPNVLTDCVADLGMTLMLDAARRVPQAERFLRDGQWLKGNYPAGVKVTGKRAGICGLGRIGTALAKRLAGFDMEIMYYDIEPKTNLPYRLMPSLLDLARNSDFFFVACYGGPTTRKLIDEEVLRAIGAKGILVNIARGSIVDEAALVRVLEDKALGAAGLDVFEDEPNVPAKLLTFDNVVVTPHIASNTHETRAAMGKLMCDNLIAYFSGKPVLTRVEV